MTSRRSLYRRLTVPLLGPLLLAMLAAWAIGAGIVTRTLELRVESQSRNAASVLATWGLPYTPELLRRLALLQQADFALLDQDGRVVVSTSDAVGRALAEPLAEFLARPRTVPATFRLESPIRSVAVYQPIAASNDPRYSALVAVAPLADAERRRDVQRYGSGSPRWPPPSCSALCCSCWCATSRDRCRSCQPWQIA